jgi:hypothetical protein
MNELNYTIQVNKAPSQED